jgi:hypothetical protein
LNKAKLAEFEFVEAEDGAAGLAKFNPEEIDIVVACNSGEALASFELIINGKKAEPESYPFIQMTQGITRQP